MHRQSLNNSTKTFKCHSGVEQTQKKWGRFMSGFDEKIQLLRGSPTEGGKLYHTKDGEVIPLSSSWVVLLHQHFSFFFPTAILYFSFVCVTLIFSFPAAGEMINRNLSELTRLNLTKKEKGIRRKNNHSNYRNRAFISIGIPENI
jgi:hypothetical protein